MYIANKARSTIAIALDALSGSTDVQSGDGVVFPPTTPYMVRVGPPDAPHEDMYVTAISGDTLNFARGVLSAPREWPIGTAIELIDGDAWGIGATLATQATHTTEIATNTSAIATNAANVAALAALVEQYMYLPSGWDAAWKAAKAASGSTPASIVAIGDSVTAGQGGTDIMLDSWWALVRAHLLNTYTLGGDYYGLLYTAAFGLSTATPPLVVHGSNSTDWTAYYCGLNRGVDGANGSSLTPFASCTPPYAVVGFDILYIDYATGTPGWNYNIDGGSNTGVNTTGPGTSAGAIVKKKSITGLTPGTHTLNIDSLGVANGILLLGVVAYKASGSGILFANHGFSGMGLYTGTATNNALADTGKFPPDRLSLYQGYQGTTVSPTHLTGLGFPTQPDLALVAFGINDATEAVTRANFRDTTRRLVQSLRMGKGDACSILLIGMYGPDNVVSSSTTVTQTDFTGTQTPILEDYYEAMLDVAREYGCGYASVHALFGRTPFTNGWTTSATDPHPTVAGHAKIATFLEQVL